MDTNSFAGFDLSYPGPFPSNMSDPSTIPYDYEAVITNEAADLEAVGCHSKITFKLLANFLGWLPADEQCMISPKDQPERSSVVRLKDLWLRYRYHENGMARDFPEDWPEMQLEEDFGSTWSLTPEA